LFLLLGKVTVHKDDASVGKAAHAITIFPKTNVDFYRLDVHSHAIAVLSRRDVEAVSVTEPLANIEVKIQ
jgi:hypothetical protein